jgi:predicted Zn-dependent protease
MKRVRLLLLPLPLLLCAASAVAWNIWRQPLISTLEQAAVLEPAAKASRSKAKAKARRDTRALEAMAPMMASRNVNDIRETIRQNAAGTYLPEILLQRDSSLARWPERIAQPLRVWVADGSRHPDWKLGYQERVREAFAEWQDQGIPVHFTFVVDSAESDIRVFWTSQFPEPISGKTLWARDRHWWIVNATITLALHHNGGEPLDSRAIKAIALHEVGHLLGLDHTTDTGNIMTARVRVRDLSEADRATVRLLYTIPPGSIK